MGAAVQIEEAGQAFGRANAALQAMNHRRLEESAEELEQYAVVPLDVVFRRTVEDHQRAVHSIDHALAQLDYVGQEMMRDAQEFGDLACRLDKARAAAAQRLRIIRVMALMFLGKDDIDECDEVLDAAEDQMGRRLCSEDYAPADMPMAWSRTDVDTRPVDWL